MTVEIKNLTDRPVLMRLNSGASLHLSPAATSPEIVETEIRNNEKIKKLQGRHVIALQEASRKASKTIASKNTAKSVKRGK